MLFGNPCELAILAASVPVDDSEVIQIDGPYQHRIS
ncbi:hypothetical protein ACVWZV_002186 [Bradyrhizobium sp. GM5.1]